MQQFSFRKVVILGVLAGLIFSCAEGIRLLPFPQPTAAGGVDTFRSSSTGAEHLSYIKSFESGRGSISPWSKRSVDIPFSGSAVPASIPPFQAVAAAPVVSLTFTLVSHSSRFSRRLPGKRGPPVFFSI
jgi:hypothetical protein